MGERWRTTATSSKHSTSSAALAHSRPRAARFHAGQPLVPKRKQGIYSHSCGGLHLVQAVLGWARFAEVKKAWGARFDLQVALLFYRLDSVVSHLVFAGTQGTVGPNLDHLKADAAKAGQPLEAYVRQSIEDPNAYVTPGYAKPSVMAGSCCKQLSSDQVDQLVQYLVENSK